jgi:hypothetical protein
MLDEWQPKTDGSEWIFPSSRTGGVRSAGKLLKKDLLRRSDISTTKNVCGRAPSPDMRKAHNKLLKQLIPDGFQTK